MKKIKLYVLILLLVLIGCNKKEKEIEKNMELAISHVENNDLVSAKYCLNNILMLDTDHVKAKDLLMSIQNYEQKLRRQAQLEKVRKEFDESMKELDGSMKETRERIRKTMKGESFF